MKATVCLSVLSLSGALPTFAQGRTDYLNFEAPQVKPITVARVGGSDFLLVCNTPDNSVEVYDLADADDPQFEARIPVGLEPVSVVYHSFAAQAKNMMYTVNWLGDSVTYVELSSAGGNLSYSVVQEVRVTDPTAPHDASGNNRCDDEPMHLAVLDRPGFQVLFVSKRTASSYTQLNALPDANGSVGSCFPNGANVIMTDTGRFPLNSTPSGSAALKEPHTILVRPNTDQVWVLGHQGGGSKLDHDLGAAPDDFPPFNLDLWGLDYVGSCTPPSGSLPPIGFMDGSIQIGTTNFNMAFNGDGSALYVVGTDALNDRIGNAALLGLPTGFVKTLLYRVEVSPPKVWFRDLNTSDGTTPVPGAKSLAHATDVAVHRQGTTDHVCVVAFNSDRFGVVDVPASQEETPGQWDLRLLTIMPLNDRDPADPLGAGLAGPRGVALLDPTVDSSAADVRAYVLNRIDHSVVVIDPKLGSTAAPVKTDQFPLRLDPVPAYIRDGQSFLYSTAFSGSRFVACASCHVDARSDQMQWKLTPDAGPQPIPPTPPSGPGGASALEIASNGNTFNFDSTDYAHLVGIGFPHSGTPGVDPENAKGPMVTQSLQGLVNFEVGGELFDAAGDDDEDNLLDDLVTNAPYHWRGDKEGFRHFNEAFAGLQGMPDITDPLIASPHGGLTTQQMKNYEQFINSVHYPPNPLQPETRVYSGTLGDPSGTDGTGGLAGLKLFHTLALDAVIELVAGRSCVQCHFPPEGSNNRVTCGLEGLDASDAHNFGVAQPLESTALRGLTQKEARLELSESIAPTRPDLVTRDLGMGSDGMFGRSRNEFVEIGFIDPADENKERIIAFLREFDHGVAPILGRSVVRIGGQSEPSLSTLENEAKKANCGLAAYVRVPLGGGGFEERGYWYRFNNSQFGQGQPGGSLTTTVYKRHGSSATLTSAALMDLADASGSILIVRAVPLGSERRLAAVTGSTPGVAELPYTGAYPAPSSVAIVGTAPNSAYDVLRDFDPATTGEQRLIRGWAPSSEVAGGTFVWSGKDGTPGGSVVEPLSLRATRAFQMELARAGKGVQNAHDAPRRLQVTGNQLFQGASIRLTIPDLPSGSKSLILPIFPTSKGYLGKRVWETAVELDPLSIYTLMLGGPADPEVRQVLQTVGGASAQTLSAVVFDGSLGVTYGLAAQNAGGTAWTDQAPTEIDYPRVP